MRLCISVLSLALVVGSSTACKEEGTIEVHSLKFQGVKAVDEGRLKNALATKRAPGFPGEESATSIVRGSTPT